MKYLIIFSLMAFCSPMSIEADEISPGILRTPDDRFENIEGYPFQPNYIDIQGLRVHYLDEGPRDMAPIFLLHGEPTWSYLFRKMIPVLTDAGHRVIVPDMVGFGKSDKFVSIDDYSYQHHVDVMSELVRRLDLKETTFVGHDWGGLVGLRVVAEMPDRFARVVVTNTGLISTTGIRAWIAYPLFKLMIWWKGLASWDEMRQDFTNWIRYSYYTEDINVGGIMSLLGGVNEEEKAAYEAPYPDSRYKAGAQIFPYLIPSQLRENERVWKEVFEKWDKPFLIAFSDEDPVSSNNPILEQSFRERIPNPSQVVIKGAGHFVQEEVGPEFANLINDFIADRPIKGFSKKEAGLDNQSIF
jgi:haloalkane dehalogenase